MAQEKTQNSILKGVGTFPNRPKVFRRLNLYFHIHTLPDTSSS